MLSKCKWLVGLTIVTLLLPIPALADELSGNMEIGVSSVGVNDDGSKVNEYVKGSVDDGETVTGSIVIEAANEGAAVEIDINSDGANDQKGDIKLDLGRIIRINGKYTALEHQLDHDKLNYLDAAIDRGFNAATPTLLPGVPTPNAVPSFVLIDPDGNISGSGVVDYYGANDKAPLAAIATLNGDEYIIQTGGATLAGEDLEPTKAFSIVRKEYETEMEVALPFLPGVTFNAGYRHETREGTEQAISSSKCAGCHITGRSKEVNEETRDLKAGLTGKFGPLTVDYELTEREFINNATAATTVYDPVIKPAQPLDNATFDNRMSYDYADGALPYDVTPESEKTTQLLKARLDLPKSTTVVGSFITSEVESNKTDEPGIFDLNTDKLSTTYDAYGLKVATRLTKDIKISGKLRASETEGDKYAIDYTPITAPGAPAAGITFPAVSTSAQYESAATREELEASLDMLWRLSRKPSLRLGYEYEITDREEVEIGETTTNTFKAKINTRAIKDVAIRAGYEFQSIDNPFHNPTAALVPVTDNRAQPYGGMPLPSFIVAGNNDLYGTSFYDARIADLSNQPETVNELKFNATWSASPRFAATLNYRLRMEENELNSSTWEQTTSVPTLSAWYGASDNLSLTAAYNFFDQRSETAFCQGFYDG